VTGARAIDLSRLWAVVPIRGLETAKTRLGGELDAEERLDLVTEMLRRTLVATRDARAISGTIVVTLDPAAARLAKVHRAVGLVERVPGLNEAIVAGRSVAVARGASAVVVLPADLARVSADAIDDLVAEVARETSSNGSVVALVPDRHGAGTNLLLLAPPDVIQPSFGIASRDAHRAAAAAAGAGYLELGGPLTLDVDTAADLLLAEPALGGAGG
jgi:2-phospho-L-lactate guanylyltransferase